MTKSKTKIIKNGKMSESVILQIKDFSRVILSFCCFKRYPSKTLKIMARKRYRKAPAPFFSKKIDPNHLKRTSIEISDRIKAGKCEIDWSISSFYAVLLRRKPVAHDWIEEKTVKAMNFIDRSINRTRSTFKRSRWHVKTIRSRGLFRITNPRVPLNKISKHFYRCKLYHQMMKLKILRVPTYVYRVAQKNAPPIINTL